MQYKYKHSIIESQCILYTLEQSFTILLDYFNLHSFQLNHIQRGHTSSKYAPSLCYSFLSQTVKRTDDQFVLHDVPESQIV